MEVAAYLRSLGLGRYERVFRDNEITAEVLAELTDADLRELGLPLGPRKILLRAIAALRGGVPPVSDRFGTVEPEPAAPSTAAAPSVPEAERRQVAVLFADLAGYTRLTDELGAEDVHALLGRFFGLVDGIIQGYGGTVDKHIGDCVMAVFGAPVAHGNDPERAVRAALDIQARMPALGDALGRAVGVHIGVASGQVVASGTGSASHREYTVTGDSVNLAARLTDAAGTGEILISDAVRRALADRLDCAAAGALAIKGFVEPVRAWRLLGLREGPEPGRRPFVGRRGELHQLRAALAVCRDVGRGQGVYVRGEAGIGKTRLVEEFQREAEAAGFAHHGAQVLDFGAGTGRDAVRALVRSLLGLDLGSGREAVHAAAEAAVVGGWVEPDRVVYLNDLLDLPQPKELRALYDAMDNASRNRGKRRTVARLVGCLSRRRPLLLVVEDVHWADRLTLEHLAQLTATVAECPALLVMTSRIEGDPLDRDWRSRAAGVPLMTIDLGPLRREEALSLAGLFSDAADRFAVRCVERAAGNPLFLEQLLRHAEEGAETGVPGSVQSLVQARIDRLDPADKQALQAASVLGQRFGRDVLGHVLDRPDYAPEHLVAHLLVRPQGETFLFAHALIRDAVYDTLLKSRRRKLHRRAADWFAGRDPVLQAEHLDRADDAEAARAYLAAAQLQAAEYRYELALHLVKRGLALAVDRADRFALGSFQGEILHDLGDMPAAGRAYQGALEAANDDVERCRAWIGLAAVKRVTDDLEGALADLEQAEAAATEQGLTAERARIHSLRGNLCFPRGDIDGCLKEHGTSLELARQAGAAELEAAALGGLGDAEYMRGRMISAHDRFRRCVELCRRHGLGRIEVANLAQVAHTMLYFRAQREALEEARAAARAAARVGHQRAELAARLASILALLVLGEPDRCREEIIKAQALAHRLGASRFEQPCLIALGRTALVEGRRAEAAETLHDAVAVCRRTGSTFHGPRAFGSLALALEGPEERRRALAEAEAIIRGGCVGHNQLRFYPDAMDVMLELRDWDGVERYAAALEGYTHPEPLPWADFFIARGRALAAFGRGRREAALTAESRRLRDDGERFGLRTALPAIEAALAAK